MFESFRAWIAERRADIEAELDALDALQTSRSALFDQSISRVTDRAVTLAAERTDPDSSRPALQSQIKTILEDAFADALPDESPVSGQDPRKLFLSDALVLLGLSLKSDASGTVRGLLKAPTDQLTSLIETAQETVAEITSILTQISSESVGQGISVPPGDTRLDSLLLGLEQAKDATERIFANLEGQQPVNASLSTQAESFLRSSTDAVVLDTGKLDALTRQTEGLTGDLLSTLLNTETTIQSVRANLDTFRDNYAANTSGLNSDRVQVSALLKEIVKLEENITLTRVQQTELASFREQWLDSLLIMSALTRESRTEAAKSVFDEDAELLADYETLLGNLAQVPETDLSSLSLAMLNIRSLLLGTNTGAGFQEQYDATLQQAQLLLSLYDDRLTALVAAAATYPVLPSNFLSRLIDIVQDAKMRPAEDALLRGDIATFLNLAVGALNPTDLIASEVQTFLDEDATRQETLGKDLSDSLSLVLEFEANDIQAAQGFESARSAAIAALKNDLLNLDRLESVLDKAEAQA